ncbi:MAG: diguanylate cyclase, partial [Cyanobacteria bacterium J06631_2]
AVLKTTATVIRQFLDSDQVLIYRSQSAALPETTVVSQSANVKFDRQAIEQFIGAVNYPSLHAILSSSTSVQVVEDTFSCPMKELQVIEPQLVRSYLILPIWLSDLDYAYDNLTVSAIANTPESHSEPKLWGMLVAYNTDEPRLWQNWEISFLQKLTTQVTIAIEQSQLCCELQIANQKLQKLAILDGLTGIANRRYFDLVLDKEWQRLAREQQDFSLILCDIDYFKVYNDTYGHQQGDRCLQKVAQILQQSTRRPADLVARYGGEEFALILPNTNAPGALFLAHKIVRYLASQKIPHKHSQVSSFVTLSMGITTRIPDSKQSSSTIIEVADSLLYKAKRAGRNQVAVDNWLISSEDR